MQRKKNIRLLIALIVMIVITVLTYILVQPGETLDVERSLFAYENTLEIDRVVFGGEDSVELTFVRNQWLVDGEYEADPQRINVLFAILQQVRVRRPIASTQQQEISTAFNTDGTSIKLYADSQLVKEFEVVGEEAKSLTYMRMDDGQVYLVEIPGYKSYLAGIFSLDKNGWRNPLVFQLNWANLASVSLSYPERSQDDLLINFDDRKLVLEGISNADSTKLGNLIDDISLLYLNDYLKTSELESAKMVESQVLIGVKDIAGNNYSLAILQEASASEYYVMVDSVDYGLIEKQLVNRVTKPKGYFRASRE